MTGTCVTKTYLSQSSCREGSRVSAEAPATPAAAPSGCSSTSFRLSHSLLSHTKSFIMLSLSAIVSLIFIGVVVHMSGGGMVLDWHCARRRRLYVPTRGYKLRVARGLTSRPVKGTRGPIAGPRFMIYLQPQQYSIP